MACCFDESDKGEFEQLPRQLVWIARDHNCVDTAQWDPTAFTGENLATVADSASVLSADFNDFIEELDNTQTKLRRAQGTSCTAALTTRPRPSPLLPRSSKWLVGAVGGVNELVGSWAHCLGRFFVRRGGTRWACSRRDPGCTPAPTAHRQVLRPPWVALRCLRAP